MPYVWYNESQRWAQPNLKEASEVMRRNYIFQYKEGDKDNLSESFSEEKIKERIVKYLEV